MKSLTQEEIIEYLYQCYVKADGLWFVKVEEQFGFDKALEIDAEVWKIIPKIQARILKSNLINSLSVTKYTGKDNLVVNKINQSPSQISVQGLAQPEAIDKKIIMDIFIKALQIKLKLDRFKFNLTKNKNLIFVKITECPWHNILIKSKRENLSSKIGSNICKTEYSVFASEFEPEIKLNLSSQICIKDNFCNLIFKIPYDL